MPWTYSAVSGYTLSGSAGAWNVGVIQTQNSPVGIPVRLQSPSQIKVQIADCVKPVGIRVFGHPDLRSAWEAIYTGGTGGNLIIRKWTYGTAAAASATIAHGQTTGNPSTLVVRVVGSVIKAYIDGTSTVTVEYDIGNDPLIEHYAIGISGNTDGANARAITLENLSPQFSSREDVMWAVAGGQLAASFGSTLQPIPATQGGFSSTSDVDGCEFEQKAYLVDGTNARIFDPATKTLTKWIPSSGTLPGQTTNGTCTGTAICAHRSRVYIAQGIALWACAVNDPLDWNTGATTDGAAYVVTAAQSGHIGQTIIALLSTTNGRLIIGCQRSIWSLRGDPAIGAVELVRITDSVGVTGRGALCEVDGSRVLAHTNKGLMVIGADDSIAPFSEPVLTSYIQTTKSPTSIKPHVVHDPQASGAYVFITDATTPASPPVHLWVDGRISSSFTSPGGFFPDEYPDEVGPLHTCLYLNRVIMLGRTGKTYTFSTSAKDDVGVTIGSRVVMPLLQSGDTASGVRVFSADFIMGVGSDTVDVAIYSGVTAEEASENQRRLVWGGTIPVQRGTQYINVAGPALAVEFTNFSASSSWVLEAMTIAYEPAVMIESTNLAIPAPVVAAGRPVDSTPGGNAPDPGPGNPGTGDDLYTNPGS